MSPALPANSSDTNLPDTNFADVSNSPIADRITTIRQSLPASVKLIAVTKQVPIEAMRQAYAAGVRDFGESRIQEAEAKQQQLQDLTDVVWHLIGHLQTNKAPKALQLFQWIHSVDSLKLAQHLNSLAKTMLQQHTIPKQTIQKPKVCLQVKLRLDPNKYGWQVPELLADLPELNQCEYLDIRGLMTIPPLQLGDQEILDLFQETHQLASTIQGQNWPHIQMQELSMGMSGDYQLAAQAGSTMIRLGRTLFGDRPL
jgi:pyridoxal phosphate enzyme (YggS family)